MSDQYSQELSFDDAITAIFAGKIVEVKRDDLSTHPVWVPISGVTTINQLNQLKNNRFRQVTPTINIGGRSVPKPLTEPPEENTEVYIMTILEDSFYFCAKWNSKCSDHRRWLKLGIIHRTKEAAIAHAKALIAISGIECIEITRHMSFNIGNAIKYMWRNGKKDGQPAVQDLEKAIWYIQDEIDRLKGGK